ncbi:uncharacterized protein LOC108671887 [Hyalella azteca]|uniref:Uncharacterized protein LOC108671887 n=1 Tax=Hyalella azteca TaxID=294128 RepID=A0A8B7NMR8_HYAAZ|nr:uncharacterized protein LOC108671887 [Hyalella azteca]
MENFSKKLEIHKSVSTFPSPSDQHHHQKSIKNQLMQSPSRRKRLKSVDSNANNESEIEKQMEKVQTVVPYGSHISSSKQKSMLPVKKSLLLSATTSGNEVRSSETQRSSSNSPPKHKIGGNLTSTIQSMKRNSVCTDVNHLAASHKTAPSKKTLTNSILLTDAQDVPSKRHAVLHKSSHHERTSKLFNISGTLVALSHTFKMSTCKVYFAKFFLDEGSPHPCSRHHKIAPKEGSAKADMQSILLLVLVDARCQSWRALLKCGFRYAVHHTEHVILLKNSARVEALKVSKSTTLTQLSAGPAALPATIMGSGGCQTELNSKVSDHSIEPSHESLNMFLSKEGWFVFKGIITKTINSNLGLYELDGGCAFLSLTYLFGFVDEIEPQCDACDGQGSLRPGMRVVVQRPHVAKLPSGAILITCCGRSLFTIVQLKSAAKDSIATSEGVSGAAGEAMSSSLSDAAPISTSKNTTSAAEDQCSKSKSRKIEVPSAVLDAVIHHSLYGFYWLLWLSDLEHEMCRVLCKLGIPQHVVRRRVVVAGRARSPLSRLLQSWHDRVSPARVERNFAEEFCVPRHSECVAVRGLAQKFSAPFEIIDASSLQEKEKEALFSFGDSAVRKQWGTESDSVYWEPTVIPLRSIHINDDDDDENGLLEGQSDGPREQRKSPSWTTDAVVLCRLLVSPIGDLMVHLEENSSAFRDPKSGRSCLSSVNEGNSTMNAENGTETLFCCHLEIVGRKREINVSMPGKIVALFNPVYVIETFNVRTDSPHDASSSQRTVFKRYLMVRETDLVEVCDAPETSGTNVSKFCCCSSAASSSADVASLQYRSKDASKLLMEKGRTKEYLFRISNKYNRVILNRQAMNKFASDDLMVCCRAFIEQKNEFCNEEAFIQNLDPVSNPKDKQQPVYLCFRGSHQLMHIASISDVCEVSVNVPAAAGIFTRRGSLRWLPSLTHNFGGEASCLDFPENGVISSVSHSYVKDEISVSDILKGAFLSNCALNVVGVVRDRYHMTPTFASEMMNISEDCDHNDVGVPGCKTIRFQLEDNSRPDVVRRICVYLKLKNALVVGKYPLGLLEGATIKISGVKRCRSSSNSVYLLADPVSVIQVLSLPSLPRASPRVNNDEKDLDRAKLVLLHKVCNDLSGLYAAPPTVNNSAASQPSAAKTCDSVFELHSVLRNNQECKNVTGIKDSLVSRPSYRIVRVVASVSRLLKISLSLQCPGCGTEVSAVSGTCPYVGCYSQDAPTLSAFARVVVENGFAEAFVIIKKLELIHRLLDIPTWAWKSLVSVITQHKLTVTYLPTATADLGYIDPLSLLDNGLNCDKSNKRLSLLRTCTEIIHNYCSAGNLYRPLTFYLRPFKPCVDYGAQAKQGVPFYCLELTKVNH